MIGFLRKPIKVQFIEKKKVGEKELFLIKVFHTAEESTVVGLDSRTFLPVYMKWKGPDPYTGKEVDWIQWQKEFKKVPQAEGLLFPFVTELYQGKEKMLTVKTKSVAYKPSIPDSLFGEERPVD